MIHILPTSDNLFYSRFCSGLQFGIHDANEKQGNNHGNIGGGIDGKADALAEEHDEQAPHSRPDQAGTVEHRAVCSDCIGQHFFVADEINQ